MKTDIVRQLEELERLGIVLKSLSCVSQDQSPLCYFFCTLLPMVVLVWSDLLDSKAYLGDDRVERFMVCVSVICEAIMEKTLTLTLGLKMELGSQEQTEVPRGLLRIRSSDEP